MKLFRRITIVLTAITTLVISTGCSIVSTAPDMVALHYKSGLFSSTKFDQCIPVSTRQVEGPGDLFYTYPTNSRTYDASASAGAEAKPVRVLSKDNNEMDVPVSVTFELVADCDTLHAFHEDMGLRYRAYWSGGDFNDDTDDQNRDETPDGWVKWLDFFVGKSLDATLDRTAQQYGWRELWNDPKVKAELDRAVENGLQAMVDERMGGHFLTINTTLVQKPEPVDPSLKKVIVDEQAAVAKANADAEAAKAREIAAKAEEQAAKAQLGIAKAKAEITKTEIQSLGGSEVWIKKYGIDKGVTPWPQPIVAGGGATPK